MRKVFCEALSKELELPEQCERIISLSPALTEALFRAGLGEKVVGVSGYCVHPEEARKRPTIGSYNKIKLELVRELEPDLFLTATGYQRETALRLSEEFPVYAIPLPPTISAVIAANTEAVLVAGYYREALSLQGELLRALGENLTADISERKKIKCYYEIDLGGPVSFGAYSYITQLFQLMGFSTVYEEYPAEWVTPKSEDVEKFDPDIVIYEPKMFGRKMRTLEEVKEFFSSRNLGGLRAIRENRIFITPSNYDFFAHYGPALFDRAAPWLREIREELS